MNNDSKSEHVRIRIVLEGELDATPNSEAWPLTKTADDCVAYEQALYLGDLGGDFGLFLDAVNAEVVSLERIDGGRAPWTARDALLEVRGRITAASERLIGLADESTDGEEAQGLTFKDEGLRVSLGYIDDMIKLVSE